MSERFNWRTRFRLAWRILWDGRDVRYDQLLDCWVEEIRGRNR